MGCLSRAGCLVVIVIAGAGAYWMYGDRLPKSLSGDLARAQKEVAAASRQVTDRLSSADSARRAERTAEERALVWASLDESSVDPSATPRGKDPLLALGRASGPAFVTLSASDAAAILAPSIRRALPRNASEPALAFSDDRIQLRAVVDLRDYTGDGAIGTLLGGALGGREPLRIGGTLSAPRAGMAALRVTDLSLKGIGVPSALIPRLLRTLRSRSGTARAESEGTLPAVESDENVIEFALPKQVADVRLQHGRLTLYRATP